MKEVRATSTFRFTKQFFIDVILPQVCLYKYFHKFKHTLNLIDMSGKRKRHIAKLADRVNIKNQYMRNL